MLKIRLHGTPDEVESYVNKLENDKLVRCLSVSQQYKDRGKSEYVRVYVDIEEKK
ncbi:hypothetical protein [Priestia megaterium]|uniref:hypothetical protein n=1 Tax=Priestia megaterium TaxID=1404 RepID=UPI001493F763|nr:hypothetical protein [Priestia megaterium]